VEDGNEPRIETASPDHASPLFRQLQLVGFEENHMTVKSKSENTDLTHLVLRTQLCSEAQTFPSIAEAPEGEGRVESSQYLMGSQSEHRRKVFIEGQNGNSAVEPRPLRLLISDRTALGCELMLLGLSRRRNLIGSVVCATSGAEIEQVARAQQPEVALISAGLSDGPLAGFRVLPTLQSILPKCPVIMLLDDNDEELAIDAFRAHARGVFYRADPMEQLVKCICRVRQGQVWVRPRELRAVFDAFAESSPFSGRACTNSNLNDRELMVARLIATGQTNRQIARRLNLSEHTVKNFLYRLFEKVGVSSRVELAVLMMNEPVQNGTQG
jgi:two-component system nitrate/nitrite response regulator NarL